MARQGSALLMTVVASLALLQLVTATTYTVGGAAGWAIPNSANGLDYNTFASQSFFVGDVLEFKYNKDAHNVISFKTEEAFNACDVNNAAVTTVFEATGSTSITLKAAGMKFYACQAGAGAHCKSGQKFMIMVQEAPNTNTGGAVAPPASPPTPEPSSGAASSLAIHSTVSAAVVLSAAAMILL